VGLTPTRKEYSKREKVTKNSILPTRGAMC
jgi:hypothetical protein